MLDNLILFSRSLYIGLYGAGSVTSLGDQVAPGEGLFAPVMETEAMYLVISRRSDATVGSTAVEADAVAAGEEDDDVPIDEDVMTVLERASYNDENDGLIIRKRDPESTHPVRVASMDYFVPDKLPQPENVLESLVWDREKELDRLREKVPMARALSLAKLADKKFGKRCLRTAIIDSVQRVGQGEGESRTLPVLVIASRSSPNSNYQQGGQASSTTGGDRDERLRELGDGLVTALPSVPIAALGWHVDAVNYRGGYEDVESLKSRTSLVPVICEDFVLYGYQLFRAKAAGADVVRISTSAVPVKDIALLAKTATALSLTPVVVVHSKVQLLDVLRELPTIEYLSVSGRNVRLWKVPTTLHFFKNIISIGGAHESI